jgi:hypothetical protein
VIRLAWRQFRTQALVALGGVVAVAAVVIATRSHLVDVYDATVGSCTTRDSCDAATRSMMQVDASLRGWLSALVVVVPGLLGVFWGATLVSRELESGTFRLAWTQGVTRTRWLVTRLFVVCLAAMATSGLVSWLVTWWANPFDRASQDRFATFDLRDIVAVGHAAFAVALGVLAGAALRRTLPAMATTLVAFVAARLTFIHLVRPHLLAARHLAVALDPRSTGFGSMNGEAPTLQPAIPHLPNAWIRSIEVVDRSGHTMSAARLAQLCPDLGSIGPPHGPKVAGPAGDQVRLALESCVTKVGATYHASVTYQPAHQYWQLQWLELGIFVAAAVALGGLCAWWVRRRLR